ncbi:hypothetical protein C2G38_2206534 [Gigaspora rosea]|uniref:Integrase zinc-binding domain-containing protein n=1 Tax=Gigaspora rosea TaxID=44941 RepID=A0A397UJH6_9GLOM|nr:hypothetical protein C2G38_2206534 [Gigaspora rosea]
MASNNSMAFSFLSLEAFKKIITNYMNNRKNERHIMNHLKYNHCIKLLRNPNSNHENANFKHWALNSFRLIKVGAIEELNIKSDDNNRGTQVCPIEDFYTIICQAHQDTEHGGQEKTWLNIWQRYCFIPQTIVENAIRQYKVCITQCATKRMPAIKPIIAEKFLAHVQTKLGSWMEETKRTDWSIGLPFVIWAMNNQVCNVTKSTPYELVFGQQPQADSQMISMLHCQNIVHEEDIPLENRSASINNYEHSLIEEYTDAISQRDKKEKWCASDSNLNNDNDNYNDYYNNNVSLYQYNSIDLENNYADNLLDETFQDYKLYDVLSQTDTILEGLAQESTDSLFEESQQTSCSYTLIEDSDYESFMPIDNQSYSSRSSVDNHKLLRDKALQQKSRKRCQITEVIWQSDHNDMVKIRIPDIDKLKLDRRSLPSNELEPLGTNEYPVLDIIPLGTFVSLRNAAAQQNLTRPI